MRNKHGERHTFSKV